MDFDDARATANFIARESFDGCGASLGGLGIADWDALPFTSMPFGAVYKVTWAVSVEPIT